MKALAQVKFDDKGLIPAIAQDFETGEVLMFAWMNQESLSLTINIYPLIFIQFLKKTRFSTSVASDTANLFYFE
jgi:phosphoribosyl-AMP cyclohydrolase